MATPLRCDILTLFPDMVLPVLGQSMLKRAQESGLLEVRVHNLRDYTLDRHLVADDAPYGGGAGMVLKAEPLLSAVEALRLEYGDFGTNAACRLVLPSPQGRPFTQRVAEEWRDEPRRLLFLCGHYEGIDERVRVALKPEEVSIGDYVLTGGELPVLVMIDATARLIPGVVGAPESVQNESFVDAMLDWPHYTRPLEVGGLSVPEVLRSGNHEAIRRWRRKEALRNTYLKRPDLLLGRLLTEEDRQLLADVIREETAGARAKCAEEG
ncbi:MAG: tRNA (guanosine(37)-N1)-methyltransferase TrmD [Nitrospiraceae bacterium]